MLFNFDLSTLYAKRASNNRPLLAKLVSARLRMNNEKLNLCICSVHGNIRLPEVKT